MANTEDLGARVFGARIRARRKYNDLTLNELAVRAGISRAALSKIERGEQDTSVSNAMGLSRALGVDVGELLAPPEVVIARSSSIPAHSGYGRGTLRRDLPAPQENMEVVHYKLDPHCETASFAAHRSGSRESFFVLAGTIEIVTIDRRTTLRAGDCAQAPGDVPHQLSNPGDEPAELMLFIV
ncbi:MAG: helix-turn-helix domain-containing protein [Brevibacterium aurantiacum]|uniref:XRE family transcriptional regulator n=1 Tax=Brevibacterium aurantiacum TaxID=273384 RepID=A0A2A3YUN3_BREAU|nr:XRE family transcriptional regulator [Brevibacterium aurantiacum]MDN5607253.1 XRE family transcriptional regulator [Brevibacterium sp.]PCC43472.1 XRE family transcriptional regulator [Brevibacterium aurantiacum]PCC58215.1 XRE family transcriptional regulator [Brevibacterium aurantiacum]